MSDRVVVITSAPILVLAGICVVLLLLGAEVPRGLLQFWYGMCVMHWFAWAAREVLRDD